MPLIEVILLILHVVGFFVILAVLWALAPRHTNTEVWLDFEVRDGWASMGVAALVGMTGPLYAIIGPDAAVHMGEIFLKLPPKPADCPLTNHTAEEVKDASRVIPFAMIWTLALNGLTGFVMMITFAYTLGSISAASEPKYIFAFIGTFYDATQSHAGATVLTCIITTLTFCSAISNLATASRQMFAFARDGGLPFSSVWRYVHPKWDLPINAILFSCVFTSLLCLINLGSSTAFNAILSIGIVALLTSYLVSLSCVLWKRIRRESFPPRRWALGPGFGLFCNILGLAYLIVGFIFAFFPIGLPVNVVDMNWASTVYGGVAILSVVYYVLFARKSYIPPVAKLAKDL